MKWPSRVHRGVDWGNGLPPDALALLAKAGGVELMKAMLGVNKSWQQGFELGVSGVRVYPAGKLTTPTLPPGGKLAQRFPALECLDVAGSMSLDEAWLKDLKDFRKLHSLTLGTSREFVVGIALAFRLTDAGLKYVQGLPLTHLDLRGCRGITDGGIDALKGLSLKLLDLRGCWEVSDEGLEVVKGMPLTHLALPGSSPRQGITAKGMEFLRGMPMEFLDLGGCRKIEDAGLDALRGMPLKSLSLRGCERLTHEGLDVLSGMPLSHLDLSFSGKVMVCDEGLRRLIGLPLTYLNLEVGRRFAFDLSDGGLGALAGMPLRKLGLARNERISGAGFETLVGAPLTSLDIRYCNGIGKSGWESVLKFTSLKLVFVRGSFKLPDGLPGRSKELEIHLEDVVF